MTPKEAVRQIILVIVGLAGAYLLIVVFAAFGTLGPDLQ